MQPISTHQEWGLVQHPNLQAGKPNHLSSVFVFAGSGYHCLEPEEIFVKATLGEQTITALGTRGTPLTPELMEILILGAMDDLSCALNVKFDLVIDTMFDKNSCLMRITSAIKKIASCSGSHPLCFYGLSVMGEACRVQQILGDGISKLTKHKAKELKSCMKAILTAAGQMRADALLHYAANLMSQNK